MDDQNELPRAGFPDGRTYIFGLTREMTAKKLRDLADEVEGGLIVQQGMSECEKHLINDFRMHEFTFTYARSVAQAPAEG